MTFWRRQDTGDRTKMSSCLGLVRRIVYKGILENFWIMELFYIFIMVVVHNCMDSTKLIELTVYQNFFYYV